ncbi:MAG TPA: iron-containing alcohol dehydrogenase [Solirubrobacterales bacterium]|nr:iron-containing alcohol dehydrogenase [Solirubrobacterales bacterium]
MAEGAEFISELRPPAGGEWVEYSDERRRLLLYGGPITDPAATLERLGWEEFDLLSTERALADAPDLRAGARAVHEVASGPVSDASAAIVGQVDSDRVVALGGGRVIDSAKAVASVTGSEVAAIPTTLSGAPMTGFHRLPSGSEDEVRGFARPSLVIAYAESMSGAPEPQLRATAMNALAHGAESLYVPRADPISREAALRGAELIAEALDQEPDRRDVSALALGAILCAIAVDRAAGIALHHVLGQTAVRVWGIPHAETYAALLPHTTAAMRGRAPEQIEALARALGTEPVRIGERIAGLGGHRSIGELGADRSRIDEVLDQAMARAELSHQTPGDVERSDLAAILDAAW